MTTPLNPGGIACRTLLVFLLFGYAVALGNPPQEKTGKPRAVPKIIQKTESKTPPRPVSRPVPRPVDFAAGRAFTFNGGVSVPVSKKALTEFWNYGAGFSLGFLKHIRDSSHAAVHALGVGLDVSILRFKAADFQTRFPSVELRAKNMAFVHAYLRWKYLLHRTKRLSPFVGATIGIAQLTGATYREVIDSVRVTYYDIPSRTRLALGIQGGVAFAFSPSFAVEAEGSWYYVHNDPNIGLGFSLRLGGRVRF